jgi:hypothetical protein
MTGEATPEDLDARIKVLTARLRTMSANQDPGYREVWNERAALIRKRRQAAETTTRSRR